MYDYGMGVINRNGLHGGWNRDADIRNAIALTVEKRGTVRCWLNWGKNPTYVALPFGVILPNGGTYGLSVFKRDSSLMKVLFFLNKMGYATKREICEGVFGFKSLTDGTTVRLEDNKNRYVTRYYPVNLSGWRSPWFAGLVKAGFVNVYRNASGAFMYSLTRLGYDLVDTHAHWDRADILKNKDNG